MIVKRRLNKKILTRITLYSQRNQKTVSGRENDSEGNEIENVGIDDTDCVLFRVMQGTTK